MKKLIVSILFCIITIPSFCQEPVVVSPKIDPTRYNQSITSEFFESLESEEKEGLLECLSVCGLNLDSINWVDSGFFKSIVDKTINCTELVVWKETNQSGVITKKIDRGGGTLTNRKCIAFVQRFNGYARVTFQVYY